MEFKDSIRIHQTNNPLGFYELDVDNQSWNEATMKIKAFWWFVLK